MNRLLDVDRVFEHPVTASIAGGIGALLGAASAAVRLLPAGPERRRERRRRTGAWPIMAPLAAGPVLLGAGPPVLAVTLLSLACFREYAHATGLFRERTHPIAAGDTFFESVAVGAFAAFAVNALPIWRRQCDPRDIMAMRARMLEMPCGYVLFPEGTRTRSGVMGRFKRGLGLLVAGTSVPVVPCHLEGAFEALPPGRTVPALRRLTLTVGPALRFEAASDDGPGWRRVADEAESAVRSVRVR